MGGLWLSEPCGRRVLYQSIPPAGEDGRSVTTAKMARRRVMTQPSMRKPSLSVTW